MLAHAKPDNTLMLVIFIQFQDCRTSTLLFSLKIKDTFKVNYYYVDK